MASVLDRLPAHGLYTVAETAYVAELDSKAINNEFEQSILEGGASERLVSRPSLLYLVATRTFRTQMSIDLRRQVHRTLRDAVAHGQPVADIGHFQVTIRRIEEEVAPRLDPVEKLRDVIVIVPGVAGGEPVLAGTRLKPRLIADMLQSGSTLAELMAEHDLSEEQIALARLFDELYPRRGRPPAPRRNATRHALPPR